MKALAYIIRLVARVVSNLLYLLAFSVVALLLAMMLYSFWC